MSVETLMAISSSMNMSMDYIIYGKEDDESEKGRHTEEVAAIVNMLDHAHVRNRKYALDMLKLFLAACPEL